MPIISPEALCEVSPALRHRRLRHDWFSGLWLVLTCLASLLASAPSYAQTKPLTLEKARALVAGHDETFPLPVNDQVLTQLNHFLRGEGARAEMRATFERMRRVQDLIAQELDKYGLPEELLAIPMIETGYRDYGGRSVAARLAKPAGLWMMQADVARCYGLRVNRKADQRLDVRLETDAAVRLLGANYLRFKNWGLAVAAYNMGAGYVQRVINRTGVRDPWALARRQELNDYLAKVTAAAILIRHPELVGGEELVSH